MTKKILALLLSMVLVLSLFTACAKDKVVETVTETETAKEAETETATETEAATEVEAVEELEPITLQVTTWDSESDYINEIIDQYEAANPHVTVEFQYIVQGYDEKVQIMNASGKTPDVLMMWNTPAYVESGVVEPLDAFIAADDDIDMDQFYPVTLDWAKYKGQIWGLPKDVTPRAMYYNKGAFDAAGVAYPEDGWTWADFIEINKAVTVDDQYGFIALAGHTYMLQHFIWSNGGQMISDDGLSASGYVNSQEVVETIAWYKEVYDSSASSLVASGDANPGNAEFMSGKVAMMDNGSWPIASLRDEEGLEFGVVVPPVPAEGVPFKPVVHSATWSMYAGSEQKDAAWDFIKFCAGPDGARIIGASGFSTTALPVVNEELGLADTELGKFMEILEMPTNSPEFTKSQYYWESDGAFGAAVATILLNDADIQEALDGAALEMDAILGQ